MSSLTSTSSDFPSGSSVTLPDEVLNHHLYAPVVGQHIDRMQFDTVVDSHDWRRKFTEEYRVNITRKLVLAVVPKNVTSDDLKTERFAEIMSKASQAETECFLEATGKLEYIFLLSRRIINGRVTTDSHRKMVAVYDDKTVDNFSPIDFWAKDAQLADISEDVFEDGEILSDEPEDVDDPET